MRKLLYLILISLALGCQSESLDIRANYRIKLMVVSPRQNDTMNAQNAYRIRLELQTDSYYNESGYQLQFYQQMGLGRLVKGAPSSEIQENVLQKVPISIPLGRSDWQYTPEGEGANQLVLIAQQQNGYTLPDTVRLNLKIVQ